MTGDSSHSVDLFISDQSQLGSLHNFLSLAAPGIRVSVSSEVPRLGEQGMPDMLVLAASGGGVLAAIRAVPEFLKARRTGISITAKVKGESFTLTATNVDEVMPILERILDA